MRRICLVVGLLSSGCAHPLAVRGEVITQDGAAGVPCLISAWKGWVPRQKPPGEPDRSHREPGTEELAAVGPIPKESRLAPPPPLVDPGPSAHDEGTERSWPKGET